jgi:magnesium chelatase family protein
MLCRSHSVGIIGLEGYPIVVEADVAAGPSCLTIVGRIYGAAQLSDRVELALQQFGPVVQSRRMVVNVAPVDGLHDSPGLDLAIVAALLCSHGLIPAERLDGAMFWGQVDRSGRVRPVPGTRLAAELARRQGFARLVVAGRDARAAALPGLEVVPIGTLAELLLAVHGDRLIEPMTAVARARAR